MNNVDLVKEVIRVFCENKTDQKALDAHFSPDFEHWANGKKGGLKDYARRLAAYGAAYENFKIPTWDEVFAAEDKVVTSYVLEGRKKDGAEDRMAVMAVWHVKDGKIAALHEVDASV